MTTADALRNVVRNLRSPVVAVSGGVDSLTLATFLHRELGSGHVSMIHAASPAVPGEATRRIRVLSALEGWSLRIIDAGELVDPRYRSNPVNRCFFCKTNLYQAIAQVLEGQIVSGANLDDLGDYRPGLAAARDAGARHPYVEAGMTKADVRELARDLGLGDVAELPSSPCLSSRIETGIAIDPELLGFVDRVERLVAETTKAPTVRCRVRADRIVVELDPESLRHLCPEMKTDMCRRIEAERPLKLVSSHLVGFEAYRMGSAFLRRST